MRNRFWIISSILILSLLIVFFSTRNYILSRALQRMINASERSMGIKIGFDKAGFTGFKSIYITGLNVSFQSGDTLVTSDSLLVNPRLLPLLIGKKRLKELKVYYSSFYINDSTLKLLKHKNDSNQTDSIESPGSSYAAVLNNLQYKFFTYFPAKLIISNSDIKYSNDSISSTVYFSEFEYKGENFSGNLKFTDQNKRSQCHIQGFLNRSDHQITATLSHTDTSLVILPYLYSKLHATVGFDTLTFSLAINSGDNLLNLTGTTSAHRLALQHKRIGPDLVTTETGNVSFNIHIGDRFVEIDSSTVVQVNSFSFSPYLRFENDKSKKLTIAFIRKEFEAQQLFESLPEGLFSNFEGIKTQGNLAYQMKLKVDLNNPDSIFFYSELENKGFKIKKYGVTDFRMMNGPFIHQVYENDRLAKNIQVGPENPDFVSLEDISPYFKYSVLTSEDGDFFYHRGFNLKAFRESIATNIKEKRFARGGSTISMQLVKNVFLSRKKTISRKIEEALIVWMIENLHLSSKERMFEVYLNIIELGPGIYGIKPASYFYFRKSPGSLTLSESIYLASIIPRPKGFRYTFEDNGKLRDYYTSYYKVLGGIMVNRNQISPADTIGLKPEVLITGSAKQYLAKTDSISVEDSLFFIQPKDLLIIP